MKHHRNCLLAETVLIVFLMSCVSTQAQWTRTSGPEGGFAAALYNTPQCVLVGMENGGVYQSTDDGATWQYASTGLTGEGPGGYAFAGLDSLVFVSTGIGVSKSTNQGLTWTPVNSGLPQLGINVTDFAVKGTTIFCGGYGDGVYRSIDSGASWIKMSHGLTDTTILAMLSTSLYLYAGTDGSGIFRSSDDGVTWQPADTGLASPDGMRILCFAANTGTIVVGTRAGTYHSTDKGDSWNPATSGLTSTSVSALMGTGTNFLAGTYGSGVFKSTDEGLHWVSSTSGWPSGNVRAFCLRNGTIFGGNYGLPVVYKSTDSGATWTPSGSGITSSLTYALVGNTTRVFAATFDGVELTSDRGSTWTTPASGSRKTFYSLLIRGGRVFAGSAGTGPYLSTDSGATWSAANGGIPSGNSGITSALAADSPYVFAGTYGGVYRSTDDGTSWLPAINGMTDTMTFSLCAANGRLFAGTRSGMFVSTNKGSSWTALANGLPIYQIESIVSLDSIILAAYGFGGNPSVYKSTNNGLSWNPVSAGLTTSGAVIQTLLVDGRYVYGGTIADGVWLSTDKGESWSDISGGLSGPGLRVAALASSGGYLFSAATKGGVWRRLLSEVVSVENRDPVSSVKDFRLEPNYPNPFNPTTVVGAQWTVTCNVKLVMYDLLGRAVATLADGRYPAGMYSFTFDGSRLASGVYFCRLTAGSFTATRSMLLVR